MLNCTYARASVATLTISDIHGTEKRACIASALRVTTSVDNLLVAIRSFILYVDLLRCAYAYMRGAGPTHPRPAGGSANERSA